MQQINSPLNLDVNPVYQPKGSLRFALNAALEGNEGLQGSIVTDEGNELCIFFENNSLLGFSLIGHHRLADDSIVLFLTDNTHSVIGIAKGCNFELLINSDCLGFKTTKRISALSRTFNGCERVLYFTDSYNEYRSINIDSLEQYLLPGETVSSANTSGTGWDCSLFKHFYDYSFPTINLTKVNDSGGRLKLGMYMFSVRYVDANGNATNWIPFAPPIPITQGVVGSTIAENDVIDIQGGINYRTTNGNVVGIIQPTTKSITLDVTSLDPRFSYIQFAVIEYVEDLREPTNYYILDQVFYDTTSISYTYRGFDSSVDIIATRNELTIPTVAIDTVHDHKQIDGRLFLANVKEYSRDWAEFQRAANKVKSRWIANAQNYYGTSATTVSPKRAYYYFENKSYMRDEIYAFGVVFVFKDGSISPAFHIPGTAADNTDRIAALATFQANSHNRQNGGTLVDRELLTVVATPASQTALEVAESDVKHLGLIIGDTVERWKVFNTAIETTRLPWSGTTGAKSHFVAAGMMAFWECETATYPDYRDCNGDAIFDEDFYGNTLTGTPIRHHKFPDATLIEHAFAQRTVTGAVGSRTLDNVTAYAQSSLGVVFENIIVPPAFASEVQGWYIVRVQRTALNSTVVDKGMFNRCSVSSSGGTVNYLVTPDGRQGYGPNPATEPIDPPETEQAGALVSSQNKQGRWNNAWDRTAVSGAYLKFEAVSEAFKRNGVATFKESWHTDLSNPPLNTTNIQMLDSVLVASARTDSMAGVTTPIAAFDWMNDTNFISTATKIPWLSAGADVRRAWYVSVKQYIADLMPNLSVLEYIRIHSKMYTASDTATALSHGGDIYTTNFTFSYYGTGLVPDPVYDSGLYASPHDDPQFGCVALNFAEEPINLGLRSYGDDAHEKHPEPLYNVTYGWAADLPINYADFTNAYDADTLIYHRQWKDLNPDYHAEANINKFFALPRTHNWCDDCNGKKPNFIYYSDKTSAFDVTDNYRVVRALNVENLFPEDGPITGLFVDKDRLFATTPNSVILLPTKPQTLQGDGTTIYTGTGDVLSAPPKKLVTSDIGYAGVQDKFGINVNEFGTILTDTVRGKVFLLGQGLEEISGKGLRSWFRDNLPLQLLKVIPEYPVESLYTHINGVGISTVYDPKYRRIIIHKRDYIPAVAFGGILPGVPEADKLYYTLSEDGTINWQYNGTPVYSSNTTLFANKSFTISYSLAHQGWVSWHSWMPDYMYATPETLYSFIHGLGNSSQGIYKHQNTNYATYYGRQYDNILEFVAVPNFQTGVYADVDISAVADTGGLPAKNLFFNRVWAYTDLQSSGYKTFVPYSESSMAVTVYNNGVGSNIPYRNVEEDYRFNLPRDLVDTAYSGFTSASAWVNISSQFGQLNGYQGYIDRVPGGTTNPAKPFNRASRIRSKFAYVRLFFKPDNPARMMVDMVNLPKYPSIR